MEEKIIGIVLPLHQEHVRRMFSENKNVLVKYISRIPKRPQDFRLKKGMKVLFYLSASGRRTAGEGEIETVEFMERGEENCVNSIDILRTLLTIF